MAKLFILLLASMPSLAAPNESTINFDKALEIFLNTPTFKASENELRAIELDFSSRDLVLQPFLEVGARRANERRELLFRSNATRPRSDLLSMSLTKPFSTGTTLQLNTSWENAVTPNLTPQERDLVEWQVLITQSLWKDSFGHSTRLRWERENFEEKQQFADALVRRSQGIVGFENVYWDWALTLKESELQEKNLKRGREILKWTEDRFRRAAAEKTDYLNAKALLARRELQVRSIQQRVTQALAQIEQYVPNGGWQPNPDDLSISRAPQSLVSKWVEENPQPMPLVYLSAESEAEAMRVKADEVRDSIRPELNLEAYYGKNAIDTDHDSAFRRAVNEDHELSSVGVVFRTGLNIFGERRKAESAKNLSQAAILRKESLQAGAKIAWSQLDQELKDIQSQIDKATQLVEIQNQKSNAERERYRMGRSTAFQAITYEQEVAESEIMLWNLYALKRKTEARARLFAL